MQIQYRSSAKAADVADVAAARATCDEQPAIEGVVSRNLLPTCLRNGGGCGAVVQWVVAGLEAPPPGWRHKIQVIAGSACSPFAAC